VGVQPWEQAAVVAATADDTVRTSVYDRIRAAAFPDGIVDRGLHNAFVDRWQGRDEALRAQPDALRQQLAEAAQRADAGVVDISVGAVSGIIHAVEPTGAIVRRIVRDAEQLLRDRATTCLRDVDRFAGSIAQPRIIRPFGGGGRRPSASPAAQSVAQSH
jgi:nitronate monooxygenase